MHWATRKGYKESFIDAIGLTKVRFGILNKMTVISFQYPRIAITWGTNLNHLISENKIFKSIYTFLET